MKQKDLVFLMIAVLILLVAGYIGYTQLMPKTASSANGGTIVEKVSVFDSSMNTDGLNAISDPNKAVDYNSPNDFSGLGNNAPFGP